MEAALTAWSNNPFSFALTSNLWVVPTLQIIHIVAIAIIFSSVLMIDLRVMGWAGRSQTLRATTARFAPWMWAALATLAVSGGLLIIAEPVRQLMSLSFWLKMIALVVGIVVASAFLHSLNRNEAYWEETAHTRAQTKAFGIATLLVWVLVIFFGRMIAYDPQVFGSLSPLA